MKSETQNIVLPRLIAANTLKKDLEMDTSLEEFSPDIARLVRIDACPSVREIRENDGRLEVCCQVTFTLLYETDYRNRLTEAEFHSDFSVFAEKPNGTERYFPYASVLCRRLNCKLLGPRRFVLHASTETSLFNACVMNEKSISAESPDTAVFFRTGEIETMLPSSFFEDEFLYQETIASDLCIGTVAASRVNPISFSVSVSEGKPLLHGQAAMEIVCEPEDGDSEEECFVRKGVFPFEMLVSQEVSENDLLLPVVSVRRVNAVADLDEYGESRRISVEYTLGLALMTFSPQKQTVVLDGFSVRNTTNLDSVKLSHDKPVLLTRVFDEENTYPDVSSDKTILSATPEAYYRSCTSTEEGIAVTYSAGCELLTGGARAESLALDSDFTRVFPCAPGVRAVWTEVAPCAAEAVCTGNGVTVRTKTRVTVLCAQNESTEALNRFDIGDEALPQTSGLRFYYPDSGEGVWEVARHFCVSPEKLENDNPDCFGSGKRPVCVLIR